MSTEFEEILLKVGYPLDILLVFNAKAFLSILWHQFTWITSSSWRAWLHLEEHLSTTRDKKLVVRLGSQLGLVCGDGPVSTGAMEALRSGRASRSSFQLSWSASMCSLQVNINSDLKLQSGHPNWRILRSTKNLSTINFSFSWVLTHSHPA